MDGLTANTEGARQLLHAEAAFAPEITDLLSDSQCNHSSFLLLAYPFTRQWRANAHRASPLFGGYGYSVTQFDKKCNTFSEKN
jgi:hypothetical protein